MPTEKRSGYYARCTCGCGAVTDLVSDKGDAKDVATSVAEILRRGARILYSEDLDADGTMAAFESCRRPKPVVKRVPKTWLELQPEDKPVQLETIRAEVSEIAEEVGDPHLRFRLQRAVEWLRNVAVEMADSVWGDE